MIQKLAIKIKTKIKNHEERSESWFIRFELRIKEILIFLSKTKINIVVLTFGLYIFVFNDQGNDIILGLATNNKIFTKDFLLFLASILYFNVSIWYSTYLKLYLKKIEVRNDSLNLKIGRALPTIYSSLVILIISFAFIARDLNNYKLSITVLFTGAILEFFEYYIGKKTNIWALVDVDEHNYNQLYWIDRKCLQPFLWISFLIFIITVVIIPFGTKLLIQISEFLTAPVIISTFLAGITTLSIYVVRFKRLRKYIILALFIFLLFISPKVNNNNEIVELNNTTKREAISENFKIWAGDKIKNNKDSSKIPIILIAAEGGGIRAMNWTALVLDKLNRINKNFYNYTYGLSGVSGGSVGIAFYHAYYCNNLNSNDSLALREMIGKDCLSPVIYALLYPDFIQNFIPFKITNSDRSKWLENSWAYNYKNSNTFNQPMTDLWKKNKNLPNIFFNSCCIETGQKVIISNLTLDSLSYQNILDVSKIMNDKKKDLPLKTAASLSARFPFITSPGKIKYSKEINLVDGGYFDNSGLGTTIQTCLMISNTLKEQEKNKFKIIIIFLKNSSDNTSSENNDLLVEFKSILTPLVKVWGQDSRTMMGISEILTKTSNIETCFYKIELNRSTYYNSRYSSDNSKRKNKINLPLGWYLSENTKNEIYRQVDGLNNFNLIKNEEIGMKNYQIVREIADLIK